MKTKTVYAVAIAGITLAVWFLLKPLYPDRYHNSPGIGLTKEELIKQLGMPPSTPEEDGKVILTYQLGSEPEASLVFKNGGVTRVWKGWGEQTSFVSADLAILILPREPDFNLEVQRL